MTGKSFISKLKLKHKGNAKLFPYDEAKHEAVIRCSICTGEQVAGFRSREDGSFVGVMVIQSEKDHPFGWNTRTLRLLSWKIGRAHV